MKQSEFDHWFHTLSNSTYADRCSRKKKLRQRKSPSGNFQVDEDVWARHPNDGIMYIASVTAVNNYHRTCCVTFVDDGQTFTLPVNQIRHVTREDIKHNRYIDYGHGWTERTSVGALNTYDRYGELVQVQFGVTSENDVNDSFAVEDNIDINDDSSLPNNITVDKDPVQWLKDKLATGPFLIRIPDPEDPTATYAECPIWMASSYAEAEQLAFELCKNDFHYMSAVQRAQHRIESNKLVPSYCKESNSLQPPEILSQTDICSMELNSSSPSNESFKSLTDVTKQQLLEEDTRLISSCYEENNFQSSNNLENNKRQISSSFCPTLTEYNTLIDKPSFELIEQQLIFDKTQVDEQQSSILALDSNDFLMVMDAYTQTEPSSVIMSVDMDPRHQLIDMMYSTKSIRYFPTPTIRKKKKTCNWSLKYPLQILADITSTTPFIINKEYKSWSRFRATYSFVYAYMKFILYILLATMIIYHQLTGSTITDTNVKIEFIRPMAMVLFIASILPFTSILDDSSRPLLQLWRYPFGVP
jgi:hypothetical protein